MWRQFEGGIYSGQHACAYTAIMCLFVCTYNSRAHTYIDVDPVPCSEISRVAFIGISCLKYAATFRGRRDFEEICYTNFSTYYLYIPTQRTAQHSSLHRQVTLQQQDVVRFCIYSNRISTVESKPTRTFCTEHNRLVMSLKTDMYNWTRICPEV